MTDLGAKAAMRSKLTPSSFAASMIATRAEVLPEP